MAESKNSVQSFHYHFSSFILFIFMFHTNLAKQSGACNAAFNMLTARLCACRTNYINVNKPNRLVCAID